MTKNFVPAFQPIVNVASGQIVGYEALARGEDESSQAVSLADQLLSADEPLSSRQLIDRQVREHALDQFAQHAAANTYLALNILPELFQHAQEDIAKMADLAQDLNIEPNRIILEINNLSGSFDQLDEIFKAAKDAGFRLAFSDINLSLLDFDRLLRLAPDVIKLDLQAFGAVELQPQQQILMQMVGELSGRLGCKVICERVETERALFFALHCNVYSIQGHFLAPAQSEFLEVGALKEKMQQTLAHHFDFAMEQSSRKQWQAERIYSELLALKELLLSGGLDENLSSYHPDPAILRFFICNRQGVQISPNWFFEKEHEGWGNDDSVIGYNWSWRPYFYQLVVSIDYDRRILTSSDYIDIETGISCYTLALALDDQRVLLVDIATQSKEAGSRLPANIGFRSDVMPPTNG